MAIASEGLGVEKATANAAPILDVAVPRPGPTLNWEPVPDLPPELQPAPGDVLLGQAFWPWADLGAKNIPEHWLYMSRKVTGVIAQLAVQTPKGPRLVNALPDGTIVSNVAAQTPTGGTATLREDSNGNLLVAENKNTSTKTFDLTPGAGVLSNLIAPIGGQQIVLVSLSIDIPAAGAIGNCILQDSNGSGQAAIATNLAGSRIINLGNDFLIVGSGVDIVNSVGGVRIVGTLTYKVAG